MNAIRSIYFIDVYRLEEGENNDFDFQLFQPSITHFLSHRFPPPLSLRLLWICMDMKCFVYKSHMRWIYIYVDINEIYGVPKTITSFSKLINFVFDMAQHNDTIRQQYTLVASSVRESNAAENSITRSLSLSHDACNWLNGILLLLFFSLTQNRKPIRLKGNQIVYISQHKFFCCCYSRNEW